mmetsp:Transcript_27990/g.64311  ORF Transcript_27990/g.64311 Transcript_27990/m.64311 type:complete len:210 (+) Transcript_27990:246-875(+)
MRVHDDRNESTHLSSAVSASSSSPSATSLSSPPRISAGSAARTCSQASPPALPTPALAETCPSGSASFQMASQGTCSGITTGTNRPAATSRSSPPAPHASTPCTHRKSDSTALPRAMAASAESEDVRKIPEAPMGSPARLVLRWNHRTLASLSESCPPKSTCRFFPDFGKATCPALGRFSTSPTDPCRPARRSSTSALCRYCRPSVKLE